MTIKGVTTMPTPFFWTSLVATLRDLRGRLARGIAKPPTDPSRKAHLFVGAAYGCRACLSMWEFNLLSAVSEALIGGAYLWLAWRGGK